MLDKQQINIISTSNIESPPASWENHLSTSILKHKREPEGAMFHAIFDLQYVASLLLNLMSRSASFLSFPSFLIKIILLSVTCGTVV